MYRFIYLKQLAMYPKKFQNPRCSELCDDEGSSVCANVFSIVLQSLASMTLSCPARMERLSLLYHSDWRPPFPSEAQLLGSLLGRITSSAFSSAFLSCFLCAFFFFEWNVPPHTEWDQPGSDTKLYQASGIYSQTPEGLHCSRQRSL